jgi:hypothetical protein
MPQSITNPNPPKLVSKSPHDSGSAANETVDGKTPLQRLYGTPPKIRLPGPARAMSRKRRSLTGLRSAKNLRVAMAKKQQRQIVETSTMNSLPTPYGRRRCSWPARSSPRERKVRWQRVSCDIKPQ